MQLLSQRGEELFAQRRRQSVARLRTIDRPDADISVTLHAQRPAAGHHGDAFFAEARNPAERAAVNWPLVLAQLDSGITTKNFAQQADLTDAQLKDLPIIMITSRIAEKHREHARELGVDHYLGKPYSEEELLSLVKHYCSAEVPA